MIVETLQLEKYRLDFYRGAAVPRNFVESTYVLVFPDDLGKRTAVAFGKMRRPGLTVVLMARKEKK